jgi:hypothetical protein
MIYNSSITGWKLNSKRDILYIEKPFIKLVRGKMSMTWAKVVELGTQSNGLSLGNLRIEMIGEGDPVLQCLLCHFISPFRKYYCPKAVASAGKRAVTQGCIISWEIHI